jgi:hypothetical protein
MTSMGDAVQKHVEAASVFSGNSSLILSSTQGQRRSDSHCHRYHQEANIEEMQQVWWYRPPAKQLQEVSVLQGTAASTHCERVSFRVCDCDHYLFPLVVFSVGVVFIFKFCVCIDMSHNYIFLIIPNLVVCNFFEAQYNF